MDDTEEKTSDLRYLPVGTVVRLEEGERSIVIAGHMTQDGNTGRFWDYMGYPYPEGRQDASKDYFFDADMIAEVKQLGLIDEQTMSYFNMLAEVEPDYLEKRKQFNGQG